MEALSDIITEEEAAQAAHDLKKSWSPFKRSYAANVLQRWQHQKGLQKRVRR